MSSLVRVNAALSLIGNEAGNITETSSSVRVSTALLMMGNEAGNMRCTEMLSSVGAGTANVDRASMLLSLEIDMANNDHGGVPLLTRDEAEDVSRTEMLSLMEINAVNSDCGGALLSIEADAAKMDGSVSLVVGGARNIGCSGVLSPRVGREL
jgi:hypothetical protein